MKEESENTGLKLSIQRTKIMESFMANRWGKSGNNYRFYFLGVQHPFQIATTATKLKDSSSLGEKLWTNLLLLLSRFSHVRLCATHRRQPTRLPRPWDSPGKNIGVGCHFLLQCRKVKNEREVTQSCSTLHDPMDCSPPGPSVHGIFQARVLEWGAIAFSVDQPRQHIKKQIHHFPTKICIAKAMAFPVVRYRWESDTLWWTESDFWSPKKKI